MTATGVADLSTRPLDQLSGGQRQRVWVALALAQQADIMLLDEPTTFLDITHQIDLLELFTDLRLAGRTLTAVLHDINQAARYATHLIAMRDGRIVAEGAPTEVVTERLMADVFDLPSIVVTDPVSGTPHVMPRGRTRGADGRTRPGA
jgi:iron complex transport system ATP-binding protein